MLGKWGFSSVFQDEWDGRGCSRNEGKPKIGDFKILHVCKHVSTSLSLRRSRIVSHDYYSSDREKAGAQQYKVESGMERETKLCAFFQNTRASWSANIVGCYSVPVPVPGSPSHAAIASKHQLMSTTPLPFDTAFIF